MARVADPVLVTVELDELGMSLDARPVPPAPQAPWGSPEDIPHGMTVDLNEYPVELLRLKKCRSFRADLRHKLTIIMRAHGGYGHGGLEGAAKAIRCCRRALWAWLNWREAPGGRHWFERIDSVYAESLEKLVALKMAKKKRGPYKKRKQRYPNPQPPEARPEIPGNWNE